MRTLIAVPCMDQVAAPFAQSLAMLNREGETYIGMKIGSLIYESRDDFARMAINKDIDTVMWFDSDMTFAPDTLQRMLAHIEAGKEIVTGVYFRRRPPFSPVLYKHLSFEGEKKWEEYPDYPKDSVFEVAGCGFGCVITKTTVFLDLLLNGKALFAPERGFGEDISFCIRARELGHKIWCDSSIKCGHIGQLTIDESVYEAQR